MTYKKGDLVWALIGTSILDEHKKYVVADAREGYVYLDIYKAGDTFYLDYPNHWFEPYNGQDLTGVSPETGGVENEIQ